MSSITYWHRLEPRPRSRNLKNALGAHVRDPLWFLTRQWQVGEFHGEDAASPAYIQMKARIAPIDRWEGALGHGRDFDNQAPLEALVEAEAFSVDWATSVELGQTLEKLLIAAGVPQVDVTAIQGAYPVPTLGTAGDELLRDPATQRFLLVCGGRGIDGAKAFIEAVDAAPGLPASIPPLSDVPSAKSAFAAFIEHVRKVHVGLGNADAPGWVPERLEYKTRVYGTDPSGERVGLLGEPGLHGDLDWYAFDASLPDDQAPVPGAVTSISESVLPSGIRFPGLPKKRWWELEDARLAMSDVHVDRREIGKLLLLDFMLVHGNDWFMVPFLQRVGSMLRVDSLFVHDVFGGVTAIDRADQKEPSRWTLFSTSIQGTSEALADYFVLPPSVGPMGLHGIELEETRFFRDETANMVWAVEHQIENPLGRARPGRERSLAGQTGEPAPPPTDAPLRYRLQTTVPEHWIPFVPVQVDAARRAIALERAAMQRSTTTGTVTVQPVGRILNPSSIGSTDPYRVREEEITRSGLRVTRQVRYGRWIDGSTHVWIARAKRAGLGEGSSGLRYDEAVDTRQK
ncbi:MAG: hypothetical protein QNJ97_07590 [Myxococcota bacterium]|nr:hypothetical protein [Myxococcota bacterium]